MAVAVSVIFVGMGYATGAVDGGDGRDDNVGGLVGLNNFDGTITASYASGDGDGGDGDGDQVGGLVGYNSGTITASYASGDADGGDGNSDTVGGLVGSDGGTITASYASGDVDGGDGGIDWVGGLVGLNTGAITTSYASGAVDGGDGDEDLVGGLVGRNDSGTITASYGFGTKAGGEIAGVDRSSDASPAGTVATAAALTQANSSTSTPAGTNDWPTRVWDFTIGMNPGLKWITGFVSGGATDILKYPCDMALLPTLPTQQTCSGIIPGQVRTP